LHREQDLSNFQGFNSQKMTKNQSQLLRSQSIEIFLWVGLQGGSSAHQKFELFPVFRKIPRKVPFIRLITECKVISSRSRDFKRFLSLFRGFPGFVFSF